MPKQWLLGQHREVCALRGKGWMKKHRSVDFIHKHPYYCLVAYHMVLIKELKKREVHINSNWLDYGYRGKNLPPVPLLFPEEIDERIESSILSGKPIYPEHDEERYLSDVSNLQNAIVRYNQRMKQLYSHFKPINIQRILVKTKGGIRVTSSLVCY